MGVTPDRAPGPSLEEELQLEDRTADGNPTVDGAIRFVGDDFVGKTSSGVKSLTAGGSGGITEPQHEALDTIAHEIVEGSYEEYTYSGSRVTNITVWETAAKLKKIREEQYTYSGLRVTQAVTIQYDGAGVESYRLTETYTYSGSRVSSVTRVRT